MLSRTLLTLALLHGITFGNPLDVDKRKTSTTACNYNNCLRVMTNTPAVASSFCSTWLQPTVYVTVTPTVTISGSSTISSTIPTTTVGPVIPAHISAQCTLTSAPPITSRLSSACSCISVVPAAGTVTLTSYAPATTTTIPLPCNGVTSPYASNGKTYDVSCSGSVAGPYNSYTTGVTFELCITIGSYGPNAGVKWLTAEQNGGVNECFIYTDLSTVFSMTGGSDAIAVVRDFTPIPLPCLAVSNPYISNGKTFDVVCTTYYYGAVISKNSGTIPDLGSCVDLCAVTTGCVAIDWFTAAEAGSKTLCILFSSVTANYGQAGVTFAVLEGYSSSAYP